MVLRRPLVAAFVVAGEARHHLLLGGKITCLKIGQKLDCFLAAQHGSSTTAMKNDDIAVITALNSEPKVIFRSAAH